MTTKLSVSEQGERTFVGEARRGSAAKGIGSAQAEATGGGA